MSTLTERNNIHVALFLSKNFLSGLILYAFKHYIYFLRGHIHLFKPGKLSLLFS